MAGGGIHGVQRGVGAVHGDIWTVPGPDFIHGQWTTQPDKDASFPPCSRQLPSLFPIIAYLAIIYNMSRETSSPSPCSSSAALSNIESPRPLLAYLPSPILSPNLAATVASFPVPTSPAGRFFAPDLSNIKSPQSSAPSATTFSGIEGPPSPALSARTFGGIERPLSLLADAPIPASRLNPSATVAARPVPTPEPCKSLDVRMGQAPG